MKKLLSVFLCVMMVLLGSDQGWHGEFEGRF